MLQAGRGETLVEKYEVVIRDANRDSGADTVAGIGRKLAGFGFRVGACTKQVSRSNDAARVCRKIHTRK